MDLIESWYAADGRRITLAYLVEDDASGVVALTGDPDASGWSVIVRYDNEYVAGHALPRPVPPRVLRPEGPPPCSTAPSLPLGFPCRSCSARSPRHAAQATFPTPCSPPPSPDR